MEQASESPFDARRVRGFLAEAQISHKRFAKTCGLSRPCVCSVLAGGVQPGELARITVARGMRAIGLDREVVSDAS